MLDLLSKYYPSQYFGCADIDLMPPQLTIKSIKEEDIKSRTGAIEKKPVIYFEEDERGLILSVGRVKSLQALFGKDARTYPDRKIRLRVGSYNGIDTIEIVEPLEVMDRGDKNDDVPF